MIKRMLAITLLVILLPVMNVYAAEDAQDASSRYAEITRNDSSEDVSGVGQYIVCANDKYIFASTCYNANKVDKYHANAIYVIDKESLELVTVIQSAISETLYYKVADITVFGDELYVSYVRYSVGSGTNLSVGSGNPCIYKYNVEEIISGDTVTVSATLGSRYTGLAGFSEEVLCRVDVPNKALAFANMNDFSTKASIALTDDFAETFNTSVTRLYIKDGYLFAYGEKDVYIFDMSMILGGNSDTCENAYKGSVSLNGINSLKAKDNLLYISSSSGLYIYDTTETKAAGVGTQINPMQVSVLDFTTYSIDICKDTMFVSVNGALKAYDITGTVPVLMCEIETDKNYNDIKIVGDKLYGVASGLDCFVIEGTDIASSDGNEKEQAYLTKDGEISSGALDICSNKEYIFAKSLSGDEIKIYDVIERAYLTSITKSTNGRRHTVCDMQLSEDTLYVLYEPSENSLGYVMKYDVKAIESGAVISEAEVTSAKSDCLFYVSGDFLYLYDSAGGVVKKITSDGVQKAMLSGSWEGVTDLYVSDNVLYISEEKEVHIYSVGTASFIAKNTFTADAAVNDVIKYGNNLYLATEGGVFVFDISAEPVLTKSRAVGESMPFLYQNGDYIYSFSKTENKLYVYHVVNGIAQVLEKDFTDATVNGITVSKEQLICTEEDKVVFYELYGIAIDYGYSVTAPSAKEISLIDNTKAFPKASFDKIVSDISPTYVAVSDDYIFAGESRIVKVYSKRGNEHVCDITSGDGSYSVNDLEVYNNELYISWYKSDGTYICKYTECDIRDGKQAESISLDLTGKTIFYTDKNNLYIYDAGAGAFFRLSESGEPIKLIYGLPADFVGIYINDGYLYAYTMYSGKAIDSVYVYQLPQKAQLAESLLKGSCQVHTQVASNPVKKYIADVCEANGYLYVATYQGSTVKNNKLWAFDLSETKSEAGGNPVYVSSSSYNTISPLGGGMVGKMGKIGDFLILNATSIGELQVVNMKTRGSPFKESAVSLENGDNCRFYDMVVTVDGIYAVNPDRGLIIYDFKTIDISSLEFASGENGVSAKVSFVNASGESFKGKLILAAYSGGELIDVQVSNVELSEICGEFETEPIQYQTEGITLKAMLFKDFADLEPLCEAKTFINKALYDEYTVYVDAVNGSDADDGTENSPFKSLERAQEKVREVNKFVSGDVTIILGGGTYELSRTVSLDERDSANGGKMIYRAKDGERPVISGGRKIEDWSLFDGEKNIYSASAGGIVSRQLFVNGKRAVRARSEGGLTNASHDSGSVGIICYDTFLSELKNPQDLELVFNETFMSRRISVSSIHKLDSLGKTLIVPNQPFWANPTGRLSNYILPTYYENAYELLDAEGEFYLDIKEDKIYYKPKADEDMETAEIIIPALEELVNIGGSTYFEKIEGISFEGITFSHSTWLKPTTDGGFYPAQNGYFRKPGGNAFDDVAIINAGVTVNSAKGIEFEKCEFSHMGGAGLRLINAVCDALVSRCHFYDISSGGIFVGEVNYEDENPWDQRRILSDIRIENSLFHNIAEEYLISAAISLGYVNNAVVSHNEIHSVPYSGMHIGWGWSVLRSKPWSGLVIEYNYIHDIVQKCGDGGAIYTNGSSGATDENRNIIRYNHIERQYGTASNAGAAIYLDTGSSYYLVEGNVIDLRGDTGTWIAKWSTGSETNLFKKNYTTVERSSAVHEGTQVVPDGNWVGEALDVVNSAGIIPEE